MSTQFSFEHHTALVTGANTSTGQAIALALSDAGAHVFCAGCTAAAETVARIEMLEGIAETVQLDLSDPLAGCRIFADLPPIDILVNNARSFRRDDPVDFTENG